MRRGLKVIQNGRVPRETRATISLRRSIEDSATLSRFSFSLLIVTRDRDRTSPECLLLQKSTTQKQKKKK